MKSWELLNQPSIAGRYRRQNSKSHCRRACAGCEDSTVDQSVECIGLDEKMKRRQAASGQPFFQNVVKITRAHRLRRSVLDDTDTFISRAVELRAKR